MVVIRGLLWISFAALLIGSASYFLKLGFGSPLLHVSPSVRDAHLRWEDAEFSPHPTQGGDPFSLTIKNIGDGNAINVTISFVLNLNTDDLIMMAKNSGLFSSKHIEGDATQLKVPTRSGFSFNSAAQIDLTADNVVRRDEIAVHKEILVAYPPGIRNAIYLWLLVTSYSRHTASETEWKKDNTFTADDPRLHDYSAIDKHLTDQLQKQLRDPVLLIPNVTITTTCQNHKYYPSDTVTTIRSIFTYDPDRWAQWKRDERQYRPHKGDLVNAWLASRGIVQAPGDYSIGQIEGGKEEIQTWNVAKLGAEPTEGELWFMIPRIRDQQQVLSGGEGVLSFEDEKNPSEGQFNISKGRKLFTPR